jgi:hypothetical protein
VKIADRARRQRAAVAHRVDTERGYVAHYRG